MIGLDEFNAATLTLEPDHDAFLRAAEIDEAAFAKWLIAQADTMAFAAEARTPDMPPHLAFMTVVALAFRQGWTMAQAYGVTLDADRIERDHYRDTARSYGRVLQALCEREGGELVIPLDEMSDDTVMIVVEVETDDETVRVRLEEALGGG